MLPQPSEQRWLLPTPLPAGMGGDGVAGRVGGKESPVEPLAPELLAVLQRRGFSDPAALAELLDPSPAPDPAAHFPHLARAVQRLVDACQNAEVVAICGDYDADGMTSTALLVGVLTRLGARPQAAIPSRMADGYGLNAAMVERLAGEGIGLLITVDNGVAAREALDRAAELGVAVILTDHHTLPAELPPHLALLHPAVTPESSPYRGLAGVGLAFVLASSLCRHLGRSDGLDVALNLFCIGTIADMAPLLGVNRRWLMDGLPRLRRTALPGLQALQRLAGVEEGPLDAETVAFQIAPRINAVGRLGDPRLVVDLLTTEDGERAVDLARDCETLNRQRRELCRAIEAEALALLEADGSERPPFLLLAQNHWHHGVIGIVAARLVERFGRPAALLAGDGDGRLRASVRAPRGFAVDQALLACTDLLERHGGHPAAGGFTVRAEAITALHERLNSLAGQWLETSGDGMVVEPDAMLPLDRIDPSFWSQLQKLGPFGSGHAAPVFWSGRCQVLEQKLLRGGHLDLRLEQNGARIRALAWGWQGEANLPALVDVAYRLRRDRWQGQDRLQLELAGVRPSSGSEVVVRRRDRTYWCRREGTDLVIRNQAGEELLARLDGAGAASGDHHPWVQALVRDASLALGLSP